MVDNTNYSVKLTLWGKQAEQFGTPADPVIAFKGVKVSDFNGKWISQFANTFLILLSTRAILVPPQLWVYGR